MVKLAGEKLLLRAPEPEDIDLLYLWENDPEVWSVSNTLTPFSHYTLKNYIENAHLDIFQAKQVRLMIEICDSFVTIGTIDLFDYDPYHSRAGVGILIGDISQRRKGYAGEALDLVIGYSFEVLNLHQLYCGIGEDNLASIKLFQSRNFRQYGERKEWLKTPRGWQSEILFQLIRNP